ncbi:hypothetical protein [Prosthecobacter sp.]|uniref:glycosyltransferase family 39 protein n=1 Tax=Prosthecobacter sp. TaxID=1965333 RepID=UPI00248A6995|nr:hypothetical protein [Prosthecobacter sp.]MDI1315124.1 hypothetical protein [Prosthecobacter sp.]
MMKPYSNRWLQLLTLAGMALLCWNAGTTTIWDDETNGFFLAKEPLPELMQLMASNVHEDPPLYDLALHYWQQWAGYAPFKLRLLSILCWIFALWGLFKCGARWGGARAGWMVLAVAVWMPYHWMFPAAMRWYSMFAALAIWNLHALLRAIGLPRNQPEVESRFQWGDFAVYVLSGTAMWYCNYSAPVVFLGQGVALLLTVAFKKGPWVWMISGWAVIGLLYLPWLPVFFRQLGLSVSAFSFPYTAASLYAIFAGEVSTPYAWWISLPVVVAAVAALALGLQTRRTTQFMTVIVVVILGVLVAKNVIWTKRLLIFTPFVALLIGTALASISRESARLQRLAKVVFLGAAVAILIGSLTNLIRRDGWLTYRWLVPTGEVVAGIRKEQPGSLILSNSNSVAFYCQDPHGLAWFGRFPERVLEMEMMPFYSHLEPNPLKLIIGRLSQTEKAVYIHDSSSVAYSSVLPWIESQMQEAGFAKENVVPLAMASAGYLQHHPGVVGQISPIDSARLVVVYFQRVSRP